MPGPAAALWDVLAVKLYVLGIALGVATVPVILLTRKSSQSKLAWIFTVLAWPWLGVAIFGLFGRNTLKRRVVQLRRAQLSSLGPVDVKASRARTSSGEAPGRLSRDLLTEALATGGMPPYPGNALDLYGEGSALFEAMAKAVAAARRHVHVEVYILKADRTGAAVVDLLASTARRGVEVRLVYDAFGAQRLRPEFLAPLRAAGGEAAGFLPFRGLRNAFRVNLRNHRKLVVVDGATAFLGGRNIGDEYAHDPLWRDLHAAVRGPVVCGLQRVFVEDWHFATGRLLDDDRYFDGAQPSGEVPLQVLPDGPDSETNLIEDLFFSAIVGARRSVDLVSPYFVPTEPLLASIRSALARGRRVRVLTGRVVDHRVVRWAAESLFPDLIAAGLEIRLHPGMMHSKVLVVDDEWGTFGSANFDARSLRLNFELNVGVPHRPSAVRLREYVDAECAVSDRLRPEDVRWGVGGRLLRQAAGLFSPVL